MGADTRWQRVAAFAEQQHGVVARRQLVEAGVGEGPVDQLVRRGRLTALAPGVYRVAGAPQDWHGTVMAAVLAGGRDALASHATAAALWRLAGFVGRRRVEVVTERWGRRKSHPGRVHETRDLRAGDRSVVDGIPVTSVVRTLIDLGAVASQERVGQALDDACRRKLATIDQVRSRFVELAAPGRNGIGTMRRLLAERPGGEIPPDSTFERKVLQALAAHGVPTPARQHRVATRDFVAFLDLAWPAQRLALECDSEAYHMSVEQFRWDRERQNRLVLLGWTVLRCTYRDVTVRPSWLAAQVLQALRGR